MRVVTIVSLGASAVLGLAAIFVAKAVLPKSAAAGGKAAVVAAPQPVGVPVVVAKSDLKFGDRLDEGKVMILRLPSNAVPQGSFTTVAQVLAQDNGAAPVVLTPVSAREPLLPGKLSGPGARASVAAEIGDGLRAYTIKVSDVTGVGGHALPGDRVDVVLMRDLTPEGDTRNYVSQVVLQNVRVLGVDLNADLTSNKPAAPSTATLEVSVNDAQKLAVAANLGTMSLALRKTGSAEVASTGLMRTSSFAAGGGGGGRHVAGSGVPVAAPAFGGSNLIVIVEGGGHGKGGKPKAAPTPAPAPAPAPTPAAPGAAAPANFGPSANFTAGQ